MKEYLELNNKVIFITGSAGFIGYHLVKRLLNDCNYTTIVGIDNFSDYYDVSLKKWRCEDIENIEAISNASYKLIKGDIVDKEKVNALFEEYEPDIVVNLAAQAGVRYSIENPEIYIESNIIGFYNILEACRHSYDGEREGVKHLVFASSSSVYGENTKIPFSTDDKTDSPVSLYAATKKSDELLGYCYSKLYGIPTTGLRFFTVYGPAGRPDMAYYSFAEKLRKGEMIDVYNYGKCKRDFTYISDIIEGIIRVMKGAPSRYDANSPFAVYNIGGGHPENLMDFIRVLAEEMISAKILESDFNVEKYINLLPPQQGDVEVTYADSRELEKDFSYKPEIDIRTGITKFVMWYKRFIMNKKTN